MPAFAREIDKRLDSLVGIKGLDPAVSGMVRAQQMSWIIRLTPPMMAGNLVASALLLVHFSHSAVLPQIFAWSAIVMILAILAMRAWFDEHTHEPRRRASHRAVKRSVLNALLLGSVWGAMPLIAQGGAGTGGETLVAVIMTGMICGGGFALAVMPQAVAAFLLPVLLGSALSLFNFPIASYSFIAVLFLTFSAIIVISSLATARTFVGRIIAQAESEERGQLIGMLLKNFEENASDWLWATDANGLLALVSPRFAAAAGTTVEELQGAALSTLLESESVLDRGAGLRILAHLKDCTAFRDIAVPVQTNDVKKWWRVTGQPFYDDLDHFIGFRGVCTDITSQKTAEERVSFLAHNDPLTGIANRSRFSENLNASIARMSRYGVPFAVLYIDLDQFKPVNDTKGHDVGDRLLVEVARRFSAQLRDVDHIARLGGDEFAVIMANTGTAQDAGYLAQRIIDCAALPFQIGPDLISIGASIGVALAPEDALEAEQLLRCADLALYRAKTDGRRIYRLFEAEMDRRSQERRALEFDLGSALQKEELELYYQPLMNADTNRPTGFEALIRWNHAKRGAVAPSMFIPIAERTGLIKEIGEWVLHEACRTAALWPDQLTVAVNLSPRQFETDRIVEVIADALVKSGLAPQRLEIEITESLLMNNSADVIARLHAIKAQGVSIALDDFGTGYSSLAYLWKFPFDKIKIDQSFVSAIENDQAARDILRTIGSLGDTLNMRITAEGVETAEQAEFLKSIAHQLQGYHFARPIRERDLAAFLLSQITIPLFEDVTVDTATEKHKLRLAS